jgi:hypothetical protein
MGLAIALGAFFFARPTAAPAAVVGPDAEAAGAPVVAPQVDGGPLAPLVRGPGSAGGPGPGVVNAATQSALDRAKGAVVVTLYCRPAAAACASVRQWLLDRGHPPKERDVDHDPAAAAEWHGFAGDTIPAFDVDGQRIAGFDPARLDGAIEYAAARRLQH